MAQPTNWLIQSTLELKSISVQTEGAKGQYKHGKIVSSSSCSKTTRMRVRAGMLAPLKIHCRGVGCGLALQHGGGRESAVPSCQVEFC